MIHKAGWISSWGWEKASLRVDEGICMISVSLSHSQLVGKATARHQQPHTTSQPQGEEMLPSISCSHFCPHRGRDTHTHIPRGNHKHACGASTCLWLGSPLRSFLFRQRQCKTEKHNDQTVLQVVLVAQLCVDFTVDVLFCLGVGLGGFQLPLHTYGKGWKWWLRVGLWIRKVTKGLWLWHTWPAHSAVFPATLVERKWALEAFNKVIALHWHFIEGPYKTMYSLSHKISTLTTAPTIARTTSTWLNCRLGL